MKQHHFQTSPYPLTIVLIVVHLFTPFIIKLSVFQISILMLFDICLLLTFLLMRGGGGPCGVMVKAMDYGIVVRRVRTPVALLRLLSGQIPLGKV